MLMFSGMNLAHRCRDRSVSGHSVTIRETLSACSVEFSGATAYEVSGNSNAHIVYFFG
jgi:5'-nucleotidase